MSTKLFSVTLTDLGEYTLTVAADSETEAVMVAKSTLLEEAQGMCPGLRILKRDVAATAVPAELQPLKLFRVHASHNMELDITVPGTDREDAKRHARRLYEANPSPWEYVNDGGAVSWGYVEEACQ